MEVMAQVMDKMLLSTAQTSSQAPAPRQDRSEFGSMVRQKQEARDPKNPQKGQEKKDAKTEDAKASREDDAPVQEKEITAEQYILATALLLQPGVTFVTAQAEEEETVQTAQAAEEILPTLELTPVEESAVSAEEAAPEREVRAEVTEEIAPETYQAVERRTAEHAQVRAEAVEDVAVEETDEDGFLTAEAPVFGPVEAAPVQVAAPSVEEPVELERPDAAEQISQRIENFLVDAEDGGRVEFTLVPESLGKVTVEITRDESGALHIQLSATTNRAAELLQKNSGGLERLLMSDRRPVQVEVRETHEDQPQYLNPNAQDQQQEQRQSRRQRQNQNQRKQEAHDFIQQLRLGLVGLNEVR